MRMLVRLFYEYHASLTLVLHPCESATFSQIHHSSVDVINANIVGSLI